MNTITPSTRARMGRSSIAAVPTTVAPASTAAVGQLVLAVAPVRPSRRDVLADVVHVSGFLDAGQQRELAGEFRKWALPPAGLRHPRVPRGHLMSVQSVCLGWHWLPYAYSRTADDTDGAPVKPLPDLVVGIARDAVAVAYGSCSTEAVDYQPDAAIVNLYGPGAHLGLHVDGEETSAAPVVTLSLGDTCVFRLAGVGRRTGPFTDIELCSGDLLVFGRENRRIYHGVPKVLPGTAPEGLGLPPGRLSITVRETGFADADADDARHDRPARFDDRSTSPPGLRPEYQV